MSDSSNEPEAFAYMGYVTASRTLEKKTDEAEAPWLWGGDRRRLSPAQPRPRSDRRSLQGCGQKAEEL